MFAVFARFPGQIERINWDAVTAKTGSWIKWHESKRLCPGSFDDLPDVNSHVGVYQLQLINQRDVDATKNILQKLGRFGDATRRNRHNLVDRFAIKRHGAIEAGWSVPSYHFRNSFKIALFVSRIFAFWRKGKVKIHTRLHPRFLLQYNAQLLFSRSRI